MAIDANFAKPPGAEVARLGLRALLAGVLANLANATTAGMVAT